MNLLFDIWSLNFYQFWETRKIEQAPCSNEESHRDPKELGWTYIYIYVGHIGQEATTVT